MIRIFFEVLINTFNDSGHGSRVKEIQVERTRGQGTDGNHELFQEEMIGNCDTQNSSVIVKTPRLYIVMLISSQSVRTENEYFQIHEFAQIKRLQDLWHGLCPVNHRNIFPLFPYFFPQTDN